MLRRIHNNSSQVELLQLQKLLFIKSKKCLGIIVTSTSLINEYVNRAQGSFNNAIGGLLRQFSSVNLEIKMKLLNTINLPTFGCGLWIDRTGVSVYLRKMALSYHYDMKKI